jgi:hypothetical protein
MRGGHACACGCEARSSGHGCLPAWLSLGLVHPVHPVHPVYLPGLQVGAQIVQGLLEFGAEAAVALIASFLATDLRYLQRLAKVGDAPAAASPVQFGLGKLFAAHPRGQRTPPQPTSLSAWEAAPPHAINTAAAADSLCCCR